MRLGPLRGAFPEEHDFRLTTIDGGSAVPPNATATLARLHMNFYARGTGKVAKQNCAHITLLRHGAHLSPPLKRIKPHLSDFIKHSVGIKLSKNVELCYDKPQNFCVIP